MPNPLNMNQKSGVPNNMRGFQQMYQMIMNSRNPIQLFEQMSNNNPQLQPIVSALKNGANPQSIFFDLCKQRGVDPNAFLRNIQGK